MEKYIRIHFKKYNIPSKEDTKMKQSSKNGYLPRKNFRPDFWITRWSSIKYAIPVTTL